MSRDSRARILSVTPDLERHALRVAAQRKGIPWAAPAIGLRREWHLAHCFGRTDGEVVKWLDEFGFETYYPMMREMHPVLRKKLSRKQRATGVRLMRERLVPLFPRYVFVLLDMKRDDWREPFRFAGVSGMVYADREPVAVPPEEIERIIGKEVDGAVPAETPARHVFKLGDTVKVKDGPLAGFPGTIEELPELAIGKIDSDLRIRVAVHVFGRATPVEMSLGQIESSDLRRQGSEHPAATLRATRSAAHGRKSRSSQQQSSCEG